jgi:hypothetical protein
MKQLQGSIGIALMAAAVAVVGCADNRAGEDARGNEMNRSPAVARVKQEAKPRTETMVIAAGTSVLASLGTALSTETNNSGDRFQATAVNAIIVGGRTVVPAGAQIHGVLRDVQSSGKIKGRASMTLDFERIEDSKGTSHAISAQSLTLQADSKTAGDVEKIAAGGVLGAIIGGIADGKKGAIIGAGAGAGAGTILMLATEGDEVELAAGQRVNVYITSPTSIVLVAQK